MSLCRSPALSIEETRTFAARLAALLAWQTEKYTKGESSSVTVETAQELMASLRYTLAIAAEEMHIPWERLLTRGAAAAYPPGAGTAPRPA